MKRISVFFLVAAALSISASAFAGVRLNGLPDNGVRLNGLPDNGVRLNGLPDNGVRLNGLPDNGVRLNGRDGTSKVLVLKGVHADRGRLTR